MTFKRQTAQTSVDSAKHTMLDCQFNLFIISAVNILNRDIAVKNNVYKTHMPEQTSVKS